MPKHATPYTPMHMLKHNLLITCIQLKIPKHLLRCIYITHTETLTGTHVHNTHHMSKQYTMQQQKNLFCTQTCTPFLYGGPAGRKIFQKLSYKCNPQSHHTQHTQRMFKELMSKREEVEDHNKNDKDLVKSLGYIEG